MKAWAEFVLKELLLPFSLDSGTVCRHLKKRGYTEWRRPLSVTAPTLSDVMADFKSSVAGVEDLRPMTTCAFVQLFACLTDVRLLTAAAKIPF